MRTAPWLIPVAGTALTFLASCDRRVPSESAPADSTAASATARPVTRRPDGAPSSVSSGRTPDLLAQCQRHADCKDGIFCDPRLPGGRCHCTTAADCRQDQLCIDSACIWKCADGRPCPNGYYCGCTPLEPPRRPNDAFSEGDTFSLTEWFEKYEAEVPGHEPGMLHLIYEEWRGRDQHLRVSLRGSGIYRIEYDGLLERGAARQPAAMASLRRREGFLGGSVPEAESMRYFEAICGRTRSGAPKPPRVELRSCVGARTGFHASLTVVAEFAELSVGHSEWTHPGCSGYPAEMAERLWALAGKASNAAIARSTADYDAFPIPDSRQSPGAR